MVENVNKYTCTNADKYFVLFKSIMFGFNNRDPFLCAKSMDCEWI